MSIPRRVYPVLAVALVASACDGPTESNEPARMVDPANTALKIDPAEVRNGGALVVRAEFADPRFVLAPQDRI